MVGRCCRWEPTSALIQNWHCHLPTAKLAIQGRWQVVTWSGQPEEGPLLSPWCPWHVPTGTRPDFTTVVLTHIRVALQPSYSACSQLWSYTFISLVLVAGGILTIVLYNSSCPHSVYYFFRVFVPHSSAKKLP